MLILIRFHLEYFFPFQGKIIQREESAWGLWHQSGAGMFHNVL